MKITADGGALCVKGIRFGNFTFTKALIEAFADFDKSNQYDIYSFCKKPSWFPSISRLKFKCLKPKLFWLSTRVSLAEFSNNNDIFLALNQAIPLFTHGKIISFAHGLSYYFFPQFYSESYYALKDQLKPMVNKSKYVVVPSKKVKTEMLKLFPKFANFKVLNYGVPKSMSKFEYRKRKKFFLFVGMNSDIKNIQFLIKIFREFRKNKKFSDFKLFLVGNLKSYENENQGIFVFDNTNRQEIRVMYSEATAYLAASYYESFNFPVLEALSQNCPVIGLRGAIIPEFDLYVKIAKDSSDFIRIMQEYAIRLPNLNYRDEVLKNFSWKKYVQKLVKLYI